jgi:hypothetical protein
MTRAAATVLAALVFIGTAAAATIRGTARSDRINAVNGSRQTVACGRGLDVVNADPVDVVRRDCETVATRIARDLTTVAGAQHGTIAEPDTFSFGATVVAAFQVGRFEGGGASAIGWASSLDAGRTWRSGLLPGVGRASDPSVGYDAVHRVWLAVTLGIANGPTSIDVSRSADGRAWNAPVHALTSRSSAFDKEWVVCDNAPASPHRGTCYIAFTDVRADRIAVTASTDGGTTWSAAIAISPPGDVVGAQPIVLPDGTLVVAWLQRGQLLAMRSRDGGVTFDQPVLVSSLQFHAVRGLRAPPLPSIEVGLDGRALLVWPDCRFRTGCEGNDVVLSASGDGLTWTPPGRVTRGGGSYLIPGIAADPRTGALAVVAVVALPGGADRLGAVLAVARDGARWGQPRRIDAVTMRTTWLSRAGGAFLGDYLSASWAGGRAIGVVPFALQPTSAGFRQALYAGIAR